MDRLSLRLSFRALKSAAETRRTSNFYFEVQAIQVNVIRATIPLKKNRGGHIWSEVSLSSGLLQFPYERLTLALISEGYSSQ